MDLVSARDVAKAMSANNKLWEKRVAEIEERVEEELAAMRKHFENALKKNLYAAIAKDWSSNLIKEYRLGIVYRAGDLVRHNGGLWQAFGDVEKAPGQDASGWVCLVNGVSNVDFAVKGDRSRVLTIHHSDGEKKEFEWREIFPIHKGKWDMAATYAAGDEVMWDGCTWRSTCDENRDEPPSENWVLTAQRGERGKKGENGLRGEKGDRGERGETGPAGAPGVDGATVDPLDVAGVVLRLISKDIDNRLEEIVEEVRENPVITPVELNPDHVAQIKEDQEKEAEEGIPFDVDDLIQAINENLEKRLSGDV